LFLNSIYPAIFAKLGNVNNPSIYAELVKTISVGVFYSEKLKH